MAKRNWEGALISSIVSEGESQESEKVVSEVDLNELEKVVSEAYLKELDKIKILTKGISVCYDDQILVLVKAILETTRSKYKQEEFFNNLMENPGFPSFVMCRVNTPEKYSVFTLRRAEEAGVYVVHIADGKSQADSKKSKYWVHQSRVWDFMVHGFIPDKTNTDIMRKVSVKRADSWDKV